MADLVFGAPPPKDKGGRPRKVDPPSPVEWTQLQGARVGWDPNARAYSAEMGSERIDGIRNRGDAVKWLAERGVRWAPGER